MRERKMQIVLSNVGEEGFEKISPAIIGSKFECDYEEYNYGNIFKAILHIFMIPFLIAIWSPKLSIAWIVFVIFLYSTVYRQNSKEFWGVLSFVILIAAALVCIV